MSTQKALDRLLGRKELKKIYLPPPISQKNVPQAMKELDKFLKKKIRLGTIKIIRPNKKILQESERK